MNDEGWQDSGISAQPTTDIAVDETGSIPAAQEGSPFVQGADSVSADGPDGSAASGGVISQDSSAAAGDADSSGDDQGHEPAPMPTHNHAIPGVFPQTASDTSAANPIGANAPSDFAAQIPIQSGGNNTGENVDSQTPTAPASSPPPAQAQPSTEIIRAESPATVQAHGTAAAAASDVRQNTTVQSHTVNNITRTEGPDRSHTALHPTGHPAAQNNIRPTAKGQSKNQSVKGRKRKRR